MSKDRKPFQWMNITVDKDGNVIGSSTGKDVGRSKASVEGVYARKPWIKLRNAYRGENPLCEHCLKRGKTVPMSVVDHILDADNYPELMYDWLNLQSLCDTCHQIKTANDVHMRQGNKVRHIDQDIMDDLETE